tara:strand:+ start:55635 stop:57389 length:1755 start_codon:yes stop_codon:yes gene_type:complete
MRRERQRNSKDPRPHAPKTWPALMNAILTMRGYLAHLLAFSLAINVLVLAVPLFMIQVFDRVLASHSLETLGVLAIGAFIALVVMAVLDLIRGRILARAALQLERTLGEALFKHQREARLGDVAKIRTFMSGSMMTTLLDAPWIPAFLLVIFLLHPMLGWIAVMGACVLATMAYASERWTRSALINARAADAETGKLLNGLAADDGSAQVFATHRALGGRWRQMQDDAVTQRLRLSDRSFTAGVSGRFVRLSLQIVLMSAAAALVISGQITPGAMVAASVIAARALGPVERAQDVWRALTDVRACLSRLLSTQIDTTSTTEGFPAQNVPELDVRRVAVIDEDGREPLFANVAFKVRGGEMVGITGATGTGKSTLARLLAGIERPAQGRVLLDRADIGDVTLSQARDDIAYLSQNPTLLPGSIADNISRFMSAELPDIDAAARLAGAEDAILDLPYGYATEIGPGQPALPQGLAQRIVLARTFFATPRVIIMDEPYTFLDNAGVEHLIGALLHLRDMGAALVIVSQRPSVLARCDRVVVMKGGKSRVVGRRNKADLRVLTDGELQPVTIAPVVGDDASSITSAAE